MTLLLFSFSYNIETKEAAMAGNIEATQALTILQQIVISQAIAAAKEEKPKEEPD